MRDTRRSIGVQGFVLSIDDLVSNTSLVGTPFADRIAIGIYDVDIHALQVCEYPPDVFVESPVRPFFIPYRALTHFALQNVLAAGKSIAQSFLANAPTRVHPVEWSVGTGAGVAAAFMVRNGISDAHLMTTEAGAVDLAALQSLIRSSFAPLEWTINGSLYPPGPR
eukprot:Amastigsp_a689110_2.p1 type:complete len:166 gc:universal Amastigsp_a689110_2:1-498(+)